MEENFFFEENFAEISLDDEKATCAGNLQGSSLQRREACLQAAGSGLHLPF